MDAAEFVNKNKVKIVNIGIIIIALIIANKIYQAQDRQLAQLKQLKEAEMKKSQVLDEVLSLDKKLTAYRGLLTKQGQAGAIDNITNIARSSGLEIISLRPMQEMLSGVYVKSPYEIELSAESFHQIGRFISKIESNPVVYIVDNISITSMASQRKGDPQKLTAKLRVSNIYFH